jgi:hypothetical protein
MRGRRVSRSVCLAVAIVLAGLAPPVNAVRATGVAPVSPMTVRGGHMGSHLEHRMPLPERLVGRTPLGSGGICHDPIVIS